MHRFFSPGANISSDRITIDDKKEVHHIRDVLRLKPNEKVAVFDQEGREYSCAIEEVSDRVHLTIESINKPPGKEGWVKLTIACAIPKKSNMKDIIDKLTQLGVDRIVPLKTKRMIVKLDKQKESILKKRWEKVSFSASKQSQRNTLAIIEPVTEVKKVITCSGEYDLKLIPTLAGQRKLLKEVISGHKNILVLIGPEGDFSEEEVELAKSRGFIPVSLGGLVLRVETAAVAVASYIKLSNLNINTQSYEDR